MLQCFEVNDLGQFEFKQALFNQIRFGFNSLDVRAQLTEDMAAKILQRAVRRWIIKKRAVRQRRARGYMSLTGLIRVHGFCVVYVMLGDRHQKQFTMTVKEKNSGATLVNKQVIKQSTL